MKRFWLFLLIILVVTVGAVFLELLRPYLTETLTVPLSMLWGYFVTTYVLANWWPL